MRAHRADMELEVIVRRIRADELDLQPDFQRGEIWDERRRRRLIDTILRDWYVPAVHIVQEDDRELVLDGQQRLATIRDFFADSMTIDGMTEPRSEEIASFHGLTFSQLPLAKQREVRRFPLPVVYLRDHAPGEPNELFFRLNQSYNLTPPEKRNALHGRARNQVKDLVREMQGWGLFQRERIGFDNQRLAYDDIVARVCVAIERNTIRRHINNSIVEDFYRDNEFSQTTVDAVREAGTALLHQLSGSGRMKFNKGTLQTWLIYCHWAPRETGALPDDLLVSFDHVRQQLKSRLLPENMPEHTRRLFSIVSLYDDRASYRVTDVSSVVVRDLAVHLFSAGLYDTPESRGSRWLVKQLLRTTKSDPTSLIFNFADQVDWGDPLLGGW